MMMTMRMTMTVAQHCKSQHAVFICYCKSQHVVFICYCKSQHAVFICLMLLYMYDFLAHDGFIEHMIALLP